MPREKFYRLQNEALLLSKAGANKTLEVPKGLYRHTEEISVKLQHLVASTARLLAHPLSKAATREARYPRMAALTHRRQCCRHAVMFYQPTRFVVILTQQTLICRPNTAIDFQLMHMGVYLRTIFGQHVQAISFFSVAFCIKNLPV